MALTREWVESFLASAESSHQPRYAELCRHWLATQRQPIESPIGWPWHIEPRLCFEADRIKAGEDPVRVAESSSVDEFLGWELIGPPEPGRGQLCGPAAAFIIKACRAYLATNPEESQT